jgi:hypothetical protein
MERSAIYDLHYPDRSKTHIMAIGVSQALGYMVNHFYYLLFEV